MSKIKKTKFYCPGVNKISGTKVPIKTVPYTNGLLFDTKDPITSFHLWMGLLNKITDEYEKLINIPGMDATLPALGIDIIDGVSLGTIKLLVDLLATSPIEILIKEQTVSEDMLRDLSVATQLLEVPINE